MSIQETPLQFGYFLALLFSILLWVRGVQQERRSDIWLGFVIFLLGMEIQDYTFGFAGINYLWEELNGFPRHFSLAFAPTVYFYLKAQINREFRFKINDLRHYIPYFVYFLIKIFFFVQGPEAVQQFENSAIAQWLGWLERISIWASYIYYFYHSLKIYREYRQWTLTQFSDTDTVSFEWLRNFIYLIIAGEIFRWIWHILSISFQLDFNQDWWWHLFTVAIICYIGIRGYAQHQPKKLVFTEQESTKTPAALVSSYEADNINPLTIADYSEWKPKIERLFTEQKIYLEPELSLADLANKLKTNTSVLSAAINQNFGKNFNDFVNEYRVEEVKRQLKAPENAHLSLLGVAFDCGFNSKSTFNRAFKKLTGQSPKDFLEGGDE